MDEKPEVSDSPLWRVILFLAGESPRSQRARANLDTLLDQVDYQGRLVREEVDVLKNPARALDNRIIATPAAALIGPDGSQEILYGDLARAADQTRLLAPLTSSIRM